MNKKNAKEWASIFSCSFLEQGLVSYEDSGAGVALLRKETIDRMLPSILGKPVIVDHQDATPENFAEMAVGYVSDAFFNPADGWFHCKFVLIDDEAKALASKGFSVSCAYDVKATAGGGEWHAIPYDEEITDGAFTHLALVSSPRYEACKIYVNSKKAAMGMPKHNENKESDMLFGKKNEKDEKKEDNMCHEHGKMVTLPNGQEISLGELVNAHMEGLKALETEGKEEDKKNAEEKPEDKKEEKPEDKENAKEEDKGEEKKEDKENAAGSWKAYISANKDTKAFWEKEGFSTSKDAISAAKKEAGSDAKDLFIWAEDKSSGEKVRANSIDIDPKATGDMVTIDDKPLDEVKNEGEEGEPEAVEHTEMLLQVKAMLDAGDIEGAKAVLAQVTKDEAAEIGGELNKEAPNNNIQMHATNEKEEEDTKENEKLMDSLCKKFEGSSEAVAYKKEMEKKGYYAEIGSPDKATGSRKVMVWSLDKENEKEEDKEEETKENSKRNSGYFRLLNSAALMGEEGVGEFKVQTFDSRINKGAERYGSKK